jgi:hypothetical protein
MRLSLEALEERSLLSVVTSFNGITLNVSVNAGPENVLVRPTPNVPGSVDVVDVTNSNAVTSFKGVQAVNYFGFDGNTANTDYFTNRTTIRGSLYGIGAANQVIYTIAPASAVFGGPGNNVFQVTGGQSFISPGSGSDSTYGGPGDFINVGSGANVIYDILPGNTRVNVASHTAVDHLFTGPQTVLTGAMAQDHTAQFFVTAPLGSGTLAQKGSTLYFAANNNGDTVYFFGNSTLVTVLYSLNDGTGFKIAGFTGVNQISAFGGSGSDTFINNSNIDDAMYGAGGSNLLVGGFGSLDLEKSGGQAATGSTAIGRSPIANDLNGSGLTNTSNTLIFLGGPTAQNIARTNSPTDVVIGLKTTDVLVSLYPDQVVAALLPFLVPA